MVFSSVWVLLGDTDPIQRRNSTPTRCYLRLAGEDSPLLQHRTETLLLAWSSSPLVRCRSLSDSLDFFFLSDCLFRSPVTFPVFAYQLRFKSQILLFIGLKPDPTVHGSKCPCRSTQVSLQCWPSVPGVNRFRVIHQRHLSSIGHRSSHYRSAHSVGPSHG